MTDRHVPSRHQWQESALPVLFGAEPAISDPWPGLLEAVAKLGARTAEIRDKALRDMEGIASASEGLLSANSEPSPLSPGGVVDLHAPMRVVLMGRTMGGKSSILTALTGSHFDRIGDGRQRFSRDVFDAPAMASARIEVVDTPGVGAHGGFDDTAVALQAALDADLIVWVNSSDSIQEESATSLRVLGVLGKPIIVALNCQQTFEGIGRRKFLRFPERVFGNREGLVGEIRRHMAKAGVEPIDVIYVHALAAVEALAHVEVAAELHAASRIEHLTDALLREHRAHSESLRALRLIDSQRQDAEALTLSLLQDSAALRAQAERDQGLSSDMHKRLERIVRRTGEAMRTDVEAAVGRRRDWHLNVTDFGKSLQSEWNGAVTSLQAELRNTLEARMKGLEAEATSTIEAADSEWSSVSPDEFKLHNLQGFGGVWGNRLIRVGVRAGSAALGIAGGTWLGATIGATFGLVGGPAAIVTGGIGAVMGGIAGFAGGPIKNLADHVFLGKDGVLRKRRDEVAKQVGPILDEVTQEYQNAIIEQLKRVRDGLARERARSDEHSESLERLSSDLTQHCENLRDFVRELDRETTSALLRMNRRERLALSVRRATRVPGVCILAEFEGAAFWESWLFPPDLGGTLAGGKAPSRGGESAIALSYALSLVDAPVQLVSANGESALLSIDADIPPTIADAWADGLAAHTGRHVQITTTRRMSSS